MGLLITMANKENSGDADGGLDFTSFSFFLMASFTYGLYIFVIHLRWLIIREALKK
jgi:hypothetical protein